MTESIRILPIFFVFTLAGCAHNLAHLAPDLTEADKKCDAQQWPNQITRVSCNDSVETPVIKRDTPVLLQSFETYSSKRKLLAQQFDEENAPAMEAWKQFKRGENEAIAILIAHEPEYAVGKDSSLNKDIIAANPTTACISKILVISMKCYDSIMHPIWQRDAPDTLEYYEEFNKKRLRLAKEYDAVGTPKIAVSANDNWQKGMKKALDEFAIDARLAIQQQQAADAQSAAQNAETLTKILQIGALAVAGAAQARANADNAALQAQPTHTVCHNYFGTVYCDTSN